MILGFDIGNTNTLLGVYNDNEASPFATFRYVTNKQDDGDSLYRQTEKFINEHAEDINGVGISSVVPELNKHYAALCNARFKANHVFVSHANKLSISIKYSDPAKLGADRIANAEAVYRERQTDSIIIDIGTAATICVLLENGVFEGGLIAPGIGTTIKALSENASNLPEIVFERPDKLVATDTVNALKSGFFYGWLSMLEGIINRIEGEYCKRFSVILTGGLAGKVQGDFTRPAVHDPLLTMRGIKYICDANL